MREEILNRMISQGASVWTNIKLPKEKKTKVLTRINKSLQTLASPSEENMVKVEIIRESCRAIKKMHPGFSEEVDRIINQFEHHLKFDSMAVLPFRQIDALTFRIFMHQAIS